MPATTKRLCPGCFAAAPDEERCPTCGEAIWIDGRLLLVEPLDPDRPRTLRGLLRGERGLEEVAVKVLDIGGMREWHDHDRFRRQSELLGAIRHPRVPAPRGDFEVRGRLLHCQTLVSGWSLAVRLRAGTLPSGDVERLADQLLDVLETVHASGVIHRDLKPDNVMIDGAGDANLVDFGAARRVAAPDDAFEPEPSVVGTVGYMAPEQLRGEARPESDLYSLGKLLEAALGKTPPAPRLRLLLRKLLEEDWRKRPASAAAARAILHPPARRSRVRWAVPPVAMLAFAGVGLWLGMPRAPAPARVEAPPAPITDLEARALVDEWIAAQNARDLARYALVYAPDFHGVRRTPKGAELKLDRAAWLADRAHIYAQHVEVAAEEVTVELAAGKATVALLQRFRRGTYAEHGHKRLIVERRGAAAQFTSEEMLDSRLGWDEADYARRVPGRAASCKMAFDPSGRAFVVTLSRHDDYSDALRAAGDARRAKHAAEIVHGQDFQGLAPGYWVLAGATNDEDLAAALAAQVDGEVVKVAPPASARRAVRFVEEQPLVGRFSFLSDHVTVVGDTFYVQGSEAVIVYSAVEPGLPLKAVVSLHNLPSSVVRLAAHDGAAHLLDQEGHWYRITNEAIVREPSFDPETEGDRADFGPLHFKLEKSAITMRDDSGAHEPMSWPVDTYSKIFKAPGNRLLLFQGTSAWAFVVEDVAPRLTKLCGAVTPSKELDVRVKSPAEIDFGELRLVTDRRGGFEIWTYEWGFIHPTIHAVDGPLIECGEDDHEELSADETFPMFRAKSAVLKPVATCQADGDC